MKKLLFIQSVLTAISFFYSTNFSARSGTGFIKNKGQIYDQNLSPNTKVKYLSAVEDGLNLQLLDNGFAYDTYTIEGSTVEKPDHMVFETLTDKTVDKKLRYHFHRIDVELVGANKNPVIIESGESKTSYNFYTTGAGPNGIRGVKEYNSITYKNIYDKIDLQFKVSNNGKIEYDFILHKGANIKHIRLKYSGAPVRIEDTKLVFQLTKNSIKESIPGSWYVTSSGKKEVLVNYKSLGDNEFGFETSATENEVLVIDPTPYLHWNTYLGGINRDHSDGVATDINGNIYTSGTASSTSNLATSGSFQSSYGGGTYDVILSKFDNTGNCLWSTYYGGNEEDNACGLKVESGSVYVAGRTSSLSDIATSNSYQPTYGGGNFDGFVVKFDTSGNRIWGTYFGGADEDRIYGITVDNADTLYITGTTLSTSGISTSGSYQPVFGGGTADAFILKMNSNGMPIWSTYYGGNGDDAGHGFFVDVNGDLCVSGITSSDTVMATPGVHQIFHAGSTDCYVAKFTASGTRKWSTYYGGLMTDIAFDVAGDVLGNIYITGYTRSTNGISTPNAFQSVYGGAFAHNGYVAMFDSVGIQKWGTYCGGTLIDMLCRLTVDNSGYLYVVGIVRSTNATYTTANAYQPIMDGASDAIIMKFNNSGTVLWSTFFGASGYEIGYDVCTHNNFIYVVGVTDSYGFSTPGAHQSNYGGGYWDGFIAQFTDLSTSVSPSIPFNTIDFYPNPTSGLFTIKLVQEADVTITNSIGQVVYSKSFTELYNNIDLSHVKNGVYFMSITEKNGQPALSKLIKN